MDAKGFGVTNRELENVFQNNRASLSHNFVGVFPADQKREFLDGVSRKKQSIRSWFQTPVQLENRKYTGGRSWTQTRKIPCSFSTRSVVTGSSTLS